MEAILIVILLIIIFQLYQIIGLLTVIGNKVMDIKWEVRKTTRLANIAIKRNKP